MCSFMLCESHLCLVTWSRTVYMEWNVTDGLVNRWLQLAMKQVEFRQLYLSAASSSCRIRRKRHNVSAMSVTSRHSARPRSFYPQWNGCLRRCISAADSMWNKWDDALTPRVFKRAVDVEFPRRRSYTCGPRRRAERLRTLFHLTKRFRHLNRTFQPYTLTTLFNHASATFVNLVPLTARQAYFFTSIRFPST